MISGYTLKKHIIMLLMLSSFSTQAYQLNDKLELAGFARAVAGYLESDGDILNNYQDEVTLGEQSLLALQPTFRFNEQLSVTGQFLAHSNSDRESGTEWLYLSYRPGNHWHFRAGKLRMPSFAYSDSIDVGYTYPWITAPIQVYNNYLFPTYNGISGEYSYAGRNFALTLEGYYGYFDGDIFMAGSRVDVGAKVSDITGLMLNLKSHNFDLRLSYHTGYNETDIPQLDPLRQALRQANFNNSADTLESDGDAAFYNVSLGYDTLSSFYRAEWIRAETEFDLAPSLEGYYFSAGHMISDWTIHLTYGSSSYSDVKANEELRPLLANPDPQTNPLFPVAAGYYQLFDTVPNGSLDTYTLGARWDVELNMALKAEVTYLNETAPRSGFFGSNFAGSTPTDPGDEKSATLYQLAWEWIF